jgi:hypothetical protein
MQTRTALHFRCNFSLQVKRTRVSLTDRGAATTKLI